jgi:hypothetical protein
LEIQYTNFSTVTLVVTSTQNPYLLQLRVTMQSAFVTGVIDLAW